MKDEGGRGHTIGVSVTPRASENDHIERARPDVVKLITKLNGPLRSVLVSPLAQIARVPLVAHLHHCNSTELAR